MISHNKEQNSIISLAKCPKQQITLSHETNTYQIKTTYKLALLDPKYM